MANEKTRVRLGAMSSETPPIYTGKDAPFVKDVYHHCLSRNPSKCQSIILFVSKPFYSSIHWRPRPTTQTRSRQSTPGPATTQGTIRRSNPTSNRAERPPPSPIVICDSRYQRRYSFQSLLHVDGSPEQPSQGTGAGSVGCHHVHSTTLPSRCSRPIVRP